MRSLHYLPFFLPLVFSQPSSNTTHLIAPALVTHNNHTKIECWKLTTPFLLASTPGVNGAQIATITNITNLAYAIIPPRFDGGLHIAPAAQIIHFLSGIAHVTLPQDPSSDLWIIGGKGGLLFAVDTTGMGHVTMYPSDEATVAIAAPFEGGVVPGYEVLNEGACLGKQTLL
jgi:hypothetical protein